MFTFGINKYFYFHIYFQDYDAIEELENNIGPDPNTLYDSNHILISTFNSTKDVDDFCNKYTHDNKYNGLKLGQKIQINDGTYNTIWYIAGFDCEADNVAMDGTPNNNGYGICLVPVTFISQTLSYELVQSSENNKPFIYKTINTTILPTIGNNIKSLLGNHIINRNVLLESSLSGSGGYSWQKSYCSILTGYQLEGDTGYWDTKYIIGEGNYKLPLFYDERLDIYEYIDYGDQLRWYGYWARINYSQYSLGIVSLNALNKGDIGYSYVSSYIRLMIYIR